jgi:hypothetical protein
MIGFKTALLLICSLVVMASQANAYDENESAADFFRKDAELMKRRPELFKKQAAPAANYYENDESASAYFRLEQQHRVKAAVVRRPELDEETLAPVTRPTSNATAAPKAKPALPPRPQPQLVKKEVPAPKLEAKSEKPVTREPVRRPVKAQAKAEPKSVVERATESIKETANTVSTAANNAAKATVKKAVEVKQAVVAKAEEIIERVSPTPKISCVKTKAEADANPRFREALKGNNLFTRWDGPKINVLFKTYQPTIDVFPDGNAVLNHPTKGKIPMPISLCVDVLNHSYVSVNGERIDLQNNMTQVSLTDPGTQDHYTFTRTNQ